MFVLSFTSPAHLFAVHCLLCSRALLRSLARSLTWLIPKFVGKCIIYLELSLCFNDRTNSLALLQRGDASSTSTSTFHAGNPRVAETPDADTTSLKTAMRRGASLEQASSPIAVPRVDHESTPSSIFPMASPTTPTSSYPEYVQLPDFPSLSEADLPTAQTESTPDESDPAGTKSMWVCFFFCYFVSVFFVLFFLFLS